MILLWSVEDHQLEFRRIEETTALSDTLREPHRPPRLLPVSTVEGAIAALLVPPETEFGWTQNGVPISPGTHLVQHTDRLEYSGRQYWVAATGGVSEVAFDPEIHGGDIYCFVTKARLQAGEEIVICPGRPGAECRSIYKKSAWDMAIEANPRFRCPSCGFDPAAGDWQPTLPRESRLPQLLELARARIGGET